MRRSARAFAPVRLALSVVLALLVSAGLVAGRQSKAALTPASAGPIRNADLERWLTHLSSDEMEGRVTRTESLVRAGDYLPAEARALGVEAGGDNGTFFQDIKVLGVKSENRSTLTVEVDGQTRVFRHGHEVSFPKNVGGRRALTVDQVEFLGYGLDDPAIGHSDYAGKDVRGKAVVWLGPPGPKGATPFSAFVGRAESAQQAGAAAVIAPSGMGQVTPAGAAAREPLPSFRLEGVRVTFNLDADYTVVRTQATRNVVGVIKGSDTVLSDTYVVLGAHYDHLGVAQPAPPAAGTQRAPGASSALAKPRAATDRILNGADDNGSGSVALLSIAKAVLGGPRPRRTLVFVWFAGEERGLWGSQYHAAYGLPVDRIAAMLNLDMVGRNRNDQPEEAEKVYPVGSDRISTELHTILVDTNASLPVPLTLDFRHNDPADRELVYPRSDHVSYARKGIPVVFFTTGAHSDLHKVTDSVDRINFPKMARIAELVYETARYLANLDHVPVRDHKGPRAGKRGTGR